VQKCQSLLKEILLYNADSFKTGTEKKLEDILNYLGRVNADGEIEVEGKSVPNAG
jgi:hypothetical protein